MSKYVKGDMTPVVPKRFRTVFFMLVACFALWGLLNNMTDNLVPAFETIFGIKPSESAGVQISFYGAYAVLAIFAAMMVEEFSYRTGVLAGLGFYILGALIYIPACIAQSFDLYLLGIFILAGGLSILETSCNPYVLSLGPEKTAVRRLNFAQAFNPVGSLAGIFLAKYLILSNLEGNSKAIQLFWVCVPYVGLIAVAAVIWFFFVRYKAPEGGSEQYEMPVQDDSMKTGISKPKLIGLYALCIAIPVAILLVINSVHVSPLLKEAEAAAKKKTELTAPLIVKAIPETTILSCAEHGYISTVTAFITNGINPQLKNAEGKTIVELINTTIQQQQAAVAELKSEEERENYSKKVQAYKDAVATYSPKQTDCNLITPEEIAGKSVALTKGITKTIEKEAEDKTKGKLTALEITLKGDKKSAEEASKYLETKASAKDVSIWGNMVFQLVFVMLGPIVFTLLIKNYREMLISLLKLPRYWVGVIAQFFYVGVQIAAWTWLNKYCCKQLGIEPDNAATYYIISLVLFIVCRWIATYYMKKFNPADMMTLFAVIAIACCFGTMYLPTHVLFHIGGLPFSANILCLILMSGGMSLMFPTIYGIALGGLNNRIVKLGAAGLIMAILGGAIITPWMGSIIENSDSLWTALVPGCDTTWDYALSASDTTIRASFIVPAICFAVVLLYSVMFRKPLTSSDK
ncbi:MAG: MFS transporter [Akkermansia sp.]|nr:MFS transporter [Akkermansia sp.]